MNTFAYKHKKASDYFEGWYIRITDLENCINYAVIFGITSAKEDPHAFIQLYDGVKLKNTYYRFGSTSFSFQNDTVQIENNSLSIRHLRCQLDDVEIDVKFSNVSQLKGKNNNRSAMGFLVKAPLQCFQEVNIMDGNFFGRITDKKETKTVTGRIYMEKTYGKKFPTKWLWLQSNHFPQDIALTFAFGKIPFLFWKINGFMAMLHFQNKEYRFTSYNFSKLKIENEGSDHVKITMRNKSRMLILTAELISPVELVGPRKKGFMNLAVFESINSKVQATLIENEKVLFDEVGTEVGLEIMNQ